MECLSLSLSLYGSCVRGTWWGEFFTEEPKGYIMEGSGNGHLSIWALLGKLEGGLFCQGHGETDKGGL